MSLRPSHPARSRRALFWLACSFALLFALAHSGGAWAAGDVSPRRGTVPTPTPRVTPTSPPLPTPTNPAARPTATPTRVTPPTRTPCLDCATPEALPAEETLSVRVNVGGDEYVDSAGETWLADQEYVAGWSTWGYTLPDADSGVFRGDRPISGTLDGPLYSDERWAMSGYRFELPNGDYALTLLFAEQWLNRVGARVFTVRVQGKDALKDLDIIAEAGAPFTALQRVVTATVTAGLLAIDFVPGAENPTLAGLIVRRIVPPTPTPRPTAPPAATDTPTPANTATLTNTPAPTPTATFSPTATASPSASATSTALPGAARVVGLFPQADALLRSGDGAVLAHFGRGVVSEAITIVYIPLDSLRVPPANEGFAPGSIAFSLRPVSAAGEWQDAAVLHAPIDLSVRYTESDVRLAGGELSRLVLMAYREDARTWLALETEVDAAAKTLTARTRQPETIALMVHRAAESDGVQRAPAAWLAGGLVAVALSVWALRRARRRSASPAASR